MPRRKRPYHKSGRYTLERQMPALLDKVKDPNLPPARLSDLERAVRDWRQAVVADLGGDLSAQREVLLDALTGTALVLATVDRYIFGLAERIVDRRRKSLRRVVLDRMRIAESLTRQLQALGLDKKEPPPMTLRDYVITKQDNGKPHKETE